MRGTCRKTVKGPIWAILKNFSVPAPPKKSSSIASSRLKRPNETANSSPFFKSFGIIRVKFTPLIVGTVPAAPGTIAAVLTGLIVPVPPSRGPPQRTSDLISDDHHFQPATFARSNFHHISNLPLYTLLSRIPPEATPC